MAGKATVVAVAALGCAAGFVGGKLADPGGGGDFAAIVAVLESRIDELEAERDSTPILQGAERPSSVAADRPAPSGPQLEQALLALLGRGSPELDGLLEASAERTLAAKTTEPAGLSAKDRKGLEAFATYVDGAIDKLATDHDLNNAQVVELKALARTGLGEIAEAKSTGASKRALTVMEVEVQGKVRRILGEHVYAASEAERVTREARGTLTWLSAAVGLTKEQHTQLDRVLDESVARSLPDIVRIRSEPLSEEDHAALERRLKEQRLADWQRVRDEVLTEEQRRRIPGK